MLRDYKKYLIEKYKVKKDDSIIDKIDTLHNVMMWILGIGFVILVVGVYKYLKRQMTEKGDQFDYAAYFFGSTHCDSLK